MQKHTNYFVGSDDGKSISFKEEKNAFIGPTCTIKFKHIGIIISLIICCLFCNKQLKTPSVTDKISFGDGKIGNESKVNKDSSYSDTFFSEDGFVFKDSNTKEISYEEIMALQNVDGPTFQRLIRMGINEIYSRRGQIFNAGGINDNYYRQYEWYNNTYKHMVKWEEFNEQEKANLRLLILIEEEYGYR